MTARRKQLGLLLAGSLLLAGCASSQAATEAPRKPLSPGVAMRPGMIMPDGSTMGAEAASPSASASPSVKPSASALMICSAEVRSDINTVLAFKATPVGKSTFVDHLYTCSYALPMGKLILSVKDSPDRAGTDGYFASVRKGLGGAETLAGLGEAAYGTNDGTVVLRKDNAVLRVDATGLPSVFGSQHAKRNDFAYEIASVILGCWTGD